MRLPPQVPVDVAVLNRSDWLPIVPSRLILVGNRSESRLVGAARQRRSTVPLDGAIDRGTDSIRRSPAKRPLPAMPEKRLRMLPISYRRMYRTLRDAVLETLQCHLDFSQAPVLRFHQIQAELLIVVVALDVRNWIDVAGMLPRIWAKVLSSLEFTKIFHRFFRCIGSGIDSRFFVS